MAKKTPTKHNHHVVDMDDAPEGVIDVAPAPVREQEPLIEDEISRVGRDQSVTVDGVVYHHTRETADGRWVYRPQKPTRG